MRLPPQNLECEEGVLGAVLLDRDALHEVRPILEPEDFYRDAHQVVYRAICEMDDAGKTVDVLTLIDELSRRGELEAVGGLDALTAIVNGVPHAANARYHAEIVRQKSRTRAAIDVANEVIREGYSNELTSEQVVANAQTRFLAIDDRQAGSDVSLHEATTRALDTMDRRWRGEEPGVRLPFPELDQMLDGFRPGRLYVIAGRPGTGKSALIFNIADHAAMTGDGGGVPSLFFALEMNAEEMAERYLSARADVNGYGLKRPADLPADKVQAIYREAERAASSRLRIDDDGTLTVARIGARVRRAKHRYGLGIVYVDYLQLVAGVSKKGANRQEEVAAISLGLKRLAKELNIPVVAACQLNRAVEGRPASEQKPRLADVRESGQIEQDAHAVLLLHAPDDAPGMIDVIVAKNRGGMTGKVSLRFLKHYTRFETDAPAPADAQVVF